jgi:hypothetical protein
MKPIRLRAQITIYEKKGIAFLALFVGVMVGVMFFLAKVVCG